MNAMVTARRPSLVALLAALALVACGPRTAREPSSRPVSSPGATAGGASSTLDQQQIDQSASSRMEDVLARVPGLQVVKGTNGQVTLRIRGVQTMSGPGEPLLVVDGVSVHSGGIGHALSSLNPRDVARVEVLKDAGSTSFYGSAGAYGVVLITTKRGQR